MHRVRIGQVCVSNVVLADQIVDNFEMSINMWFLKFLQ